MAARKKSTRSKKKDYELLPKDELFDIKHKLDKYVKTKNPIGAEIQDLREDMIKLSEHMDTVNTIFDAAHEELELEKKQHDFIDKTFNPLMERVLKIEEQNQVIATALLNIVDMARDQNDQVIEAVNELNEQLAKMKKKEVKITQPMEMKPAFAQPIQQSQPNMRMNTLQQQPSIRMKKPQQPSSFMPPQPNMQNKAMPAKKKGMFSDLFK